MVTTCYVFKNQFFNYWIVNPYALGNTAVQSTGSRITATGSHSLLSMAISFQAAEQTHARGLTEADLPQIKVAALEKEPTGRFYFGNLSQCV